jgi:hypothetical protein
MTKRQSKRNPAIKAAKRNAQPKQEPIQLSSGYWVRIRPVSAHLIDGAQAMIETPEPRIRAIRPICVLLSV